MCCQVEEEGGGGVRQHPHGAGHDQAGPALQSRGGQLRGGETEQTTGNQIDQDISQGEHQCSQGKICPNLHELESCLLLMDRFPI